VAVVHPNGRVHVYALHGARRLLDVSIRPPMLVAAADHALAAVNDTPHPRLRLHSLRTGRVAATVPLPAPSAGVAFLDESLLLVAWTDGMAGLRLHPPPGEHHERR
jgi:hypothetical protein